MSFILGNSSSNASTITKAAGLEIQTSIYGSPIPVVVGRTKLSGNLIWYGDFQAKKQETGGKGAGSSVTGYKYKASVAIGLCEGEIGGVPTVYTDKATQAIADTSWSVFVGSAPQTAWGHLTTNHPDEALGYPGLAYVAAIAYLLGTSANLPSLSFEVLGLLRNISGVDDADPADVIESLLVHTRYGLGWDASWIGDLSDYSDYCRAMGLLVSLAMTTQDSASSWISKLLELTNSEAVSSDGTLRIVPRGDAEVTGNGVTFTPNLTPVANLGINDFKPAKGDPPVILRRSRRADAYNSVKLEWLNRSNEYAAEIVEAKDQDSIETFGERPEDSTEAHCFCTSGTAQTAAQLRLQKQQNLNEVLFRLGWEHVRLEPMDIVTVTDVLLGLNLHPVRLKEGSEDKDGYISWVAEDLLLGTGSVEAYTVETGGSSEGTTPDPEVQPGDTDVVIFEPPFLLSSDCQIWCAASGGDNWGGCQVWVSSDGTTYKLMGTITDAARYGVTAVQSVPQRNDIDSDGVVYVSMTAGDLDGASTEDAERLLTICWINGEIIAYGAVEPGDPVMVSWLRRGRYGTSPAEHAVGSDFVRLDEKVFKAAYEARLIDVPLYFKFASFNLLGGAVQDLADIDPVMFTPTGISANPSKYQVLDTDGSILLDTDGSPVMDYGE